LLVLAIDTSGPHMSLSLVDDQVLGALTVRRPEGGGRLLLPAVDQLLQLAGVESARVRAIAVVTGPGSFTGVRIAVATAKGLAMGWGVPVYGVGALEALARSANLPAGLVAPVRDARGGMVYCALYRVQGAALACRQPPAVRPLGEWLDDLPLAPILFVGEGAHLVEREMTSLHRQAGWVVLWRHPDPVVVGWIGRCRLLEGVPGQLLDLSVQYLRRPKAEMRKKDGRHARGPAGELRAP